jgi:hypothetical protein
LTGKHFVIHEHAEKTVEHLPESVGNGARIAGAEKFPNFGFSGADSGKRLKPFAAAPKTDIMPKVTAQPVDYRPVRIDAAGLMKNPFDTLPGNRRDTGAKIFESCPDRIVFVKLKHRSTPSIRGG